MADTISNPSLEPLFFSVDPMSLILSQNSDTHQLKLLLDGFSSFERGPRYDDYSRLRESKLRMKRDFQKFLEEEEEPRKKQVRFEGNHVNAISPEKKKQSRFGFSPRKPPSSSSLAQSVPDFSGLLRKENRRPVNYNTTPTKTKNDVVLSGSGSRGSKSATAGEKKSKGMMGMARKSYASFEEVNKISMASINGGGGCGGRTKAGRSILGYRQLF